MGPLLSACTVLIGTIALAALARRVLDSVWPSGAHSEPLRCASFLIMTLAAIYLEVMLAGVVRRFSWPVLGALNLGLLALLLRERGALRQTARLAQQTVSLPFEDCRELAGRALVAWLLLMIVVEGAVPKSVGDDVGYHLPSIMNIVRSGLTLQILPSHGADLHSPTAYYLRGYETILAFFFQAPGAQLGVLLTTLAALAIVYFCLLDFAERPALARALTFFLASGLMIGAPYKGDYLLGALALFVMTILIRQRDRLDAAAVPVLAALLLLLALKSSTLLIVGVAILVLAWTLRATWPPARVAGAVLLAVTPGLAFYLGNLVYQGNPVFPFRVALGGQVLFEGPTTLDALPTTILGNLGVSMIVPFGRGLARMTSPLTVLLLPALLWLVARFFTAPVRESRPLALAFLACTALTFVTTPFSDNNAGPAHSQLYSGHTLRMALPLVLLMLVLSTAAMRASSERAFRLAERLFVALGALNVVWYDTAALLLKPENAFANYAPLFHTFDVRILAAGFAALSGLALFAAYTVRPLPAFAVALSTAALLHPLIEVSSFTYSPGFRYLGRSSPIVAKLSELADPEQRTSVLVAGPTGPLSGIVTPVLLHGFGSVTFARSEPEVNGCDLVVVPSLVEERIGDLLRGRRYEVRKPTAAIQALTRSGYTSVFDDALYTVFAGSREH